MIILIQIATIQFIIGNLFLISIGYFKKINKYKDDVLIKMMTIIIELYLLCPILGVALIIETNKIINKCVKTDEELDDKLRNFQDKLSNVIQLNLEISKEIKECWIKGSENRELKNKLENYILKIENACEKEFIDLNFKAYYVKKLICIMIKDMSTEDKLYNAGLDIVVLELKKIRKELKTNKNTDMEKILYNLEEIRKKIQ